MKIYEILRKQGPTDEKQGKLGGVQDTGRGGGICSWQKEYRTHTAPRATPIRAIMPADVLAQVRHAHAPTAEPVAVLVQLAAAAPAACLQVDSRACVTIAHLKLRVFECY